MELVRLTTFINLFPEKIARTNVRHSPRSVYETSTLLADRHNLFLKTKILLSSPLSSFLLGFFDFFVFFFFSFSISLLVSLLRFLYFISFFLQILLDFFFLWFLGFSILSFLVFSDS